MTTFRLTAHRRIGNPYRGRATPRRYPVVGAPFRPGQRVLVVAAVDPHVHDVTGLIGAAGVVYYLEYDCGAGQSFPADPMIGVVFDDGRAEELWREELAHAASLAEQAT